MRPVAIIGGGISGLTAAWQLHQLGLLFTLYEASNRLGGTVETVRIDDFIVEMGPDGWITEKPWARDLASELGLGGDLIQSNDATRVTWILRDGALLPIPDGMRLMVPTNLAAIEHSPLFSSEAKRAYAEEPGRATELRASAPNSDESIAAFVVRHFGQEVLDTIAAPLLSGVFGGDVRTLSVRAVMPQFVQMERTHGSLITALQQRARTITPEPIFTTLRNGTQSLIDRLAAELPGESIRLNSPIDSIEAIPQPYDHVILATPAHVTTRLLPHLRPYLPTEESSAILAAYTFTQPLTLPKGFGFLVPQSEANTLLAGTFVDQKFPHRAPPGTHIVRAFFGGSDEPAKDPRTDAELAVEAFADLQKILCPLPIPAHTLVRRWPRSLPQYAIGHLERIAQLDTLLAQTPTLHLLGNPYRGVGLPDLIRDARATARQIAEK